MTSVGVLLRQARESAGRTLPELAEELCITQRYLRAIEEDDVASLPGAFFYRSFALQYARLLGVDQTCVQAGLDEQVPREEPAQAPASIDVDPIVASTNRRYLGSGVAWPIAGLTAVLLVGSGLYSWWTRVPLNEPQQVVVSAQPGGAGSALLTVSSPETPSNPNTVLLNLSATETTWIRITSGGREVWQGIVSPGESKTVSGQDMATMKIGNAGGVEIRLNGRSIGRVGTSGEVKVVRFTPQDFQVINKPPEDEAL